MYSAYFVAIALYINVIFSHCLYCLFFKSFQLILVKLLCICHLAFVLLYLITNIFIFLIFEKFGFKILMLTLPAQILIVKYYIFYLYNVFIQHHICLCQIDFLV